MNNFYMIGDLKLKPTNKLLLLIDVIMFRFGSNKRRISIARKWGVKIGDGSIISICIFGSEPYLVSIGNNTEITYGVTFITHDGGTWIFRKSNEFTGNKFGPIIIKDNCMIGMKSILLPNVEIGPNSVVGAGSVVTKNVPPNTVYAGNPAKFICTTDEYLDKCRKNDISGVPYYMSPDEKRSALTKIFKDRLN